MAAGAGIGEPGRPTIRAGRALPASGGFGLAWQSNPSSDGVSLATTVIRPASSRAMPNMKDANSSSSVSSLFGLWWSMCSWR